MADINDSTVQNIKEKKVLQTTMLQFPAVFMV
jgi:hypothetical protein